MRRHRGRGRFAALYGQALGGAEAEVDWWLAGGIPAANCIAAYQPIGAADYATSLVNLANPGTYDAYAGEAPNFAAATGWGFTGTQYLLTDCPTTGAKPVSFIARLTPSAGGTRTIHGSTFNIPFGLAMRIYASGQFDLIKAETAIIDDSTALLTDDSTYVVGYSYSAAGECILYVNGSGETPATNDQTLGAGNLVIGRHGFSATEFLLGTMQALASYDTVLLPAQFLAVSAEMAALSGPLALPVELVSQPEPEPIPIVNLFGWRVPLCSRWTWEHIIKKVWK